MPLLLVVSTDGPHILGTVSYLDYQSTDCDEEEMICGSLAMETSWLRSEDFFVSPVHTTDSMLLAGWTGQWEEDMKPFSLAVC